MHIAKLITACTVVLLCVGDGGRCQAQPQEAKEKGLPRVAQDLEWLIGEYANTHIEGRVGASDIQLWDAGKNWHLRKFLARPLTTGDGIVVEYQISFQGSRYQVSETVERKDMNLVSHYRVTSPNDSHIGFTGKGKYTIEPVDEGAWRCIGSGPGGRIHFTIKPKEDGRLIIENKGGGHRQTTGWTRVVLRKIPSATKSKVVGAESEAN